MKPKIDRTHDSIGKTGAHNTWCEGHVSCPNTGKDECGKVMITKVITTTTGESYCNAAQVICFGCGQQHRVK